MYIFAAILIVLMLLITLEAFGFLQGKGLTPEEEKDFWQRQYDLYSDLL